MMTVKRLTILLSFLTAVTALNAQDANAILKKLYDSYSKQTKYRVTVSYIAENEMMGFKNQQRGDLTVVDGKYILKYGPNETWLNDGEAEYIGTKETDHSELIIFCLGENPEVPINYGKLFTFYGADVEASMEDNLVKVVPNDGSYKHALLKVSANKIQMLIVVDDMDMTHTYSFSSFNSNTAGVQFTIDPKDYEATVDERQGCK